LKALQGFLNRESRKIIINMSTVSPATSRYLQLTVAREVTLLTPVSGSVKPAQDGTLVILVGSTVESYEKSLLFLTY
jgi:3-hydroxyisobutyrate dehydrogenase